MVAVTRRRFLAIAPAPSAEESGHWLRVQRRAMACSFEITVDAADAGLVPAAQAALNQIDAIEARLTVFRDTSALADLNRRAAREPVACDAALFDLLNRCAELSHATEGAFDVTSTPLSRCWGFLRREGRVPSDAEVASARSLVGLQHVALDARHASVRFAKAGVEINLNAVGKGYALDCVAAALRRARATEALLSAGRSSLLAIGGRGRGWCIDLVSPRRARPIARVWLRDAALGTSGAGEQFVIADGRRLGHVIDPRTGWPAEGMLSATVVCGSAADADALSTAFLIGGPELAARYCERHPGVLALLTPDGDSEATIVIGRSAGVEVERR